MNVLMLVNSLKYINKNFKLLVSISVWINKELTTINYSDNKLIKSFEQYDIKISEAIIGHVINKKSIFDNIIYQYLNYSYYNDGYQVILLIKNGLDIHNNINDLIEHVATYDDVHILKVLLEYGFDIHYKDDFCLRWASYNDSNEVVKLSLKSGAKADASCNWSITEAVVNGNFEIIKVLLEYGADPNSSVPYDQSLLSYTCKFGERFDIVKLLLQYGADITFDNYKALTTAIDNRNVEIVKVLTEHIIKKLEQA